MEEAACVAKFGVEEKKNFLDSGVVLATMRYTWDPVLCEGISFVFAEISKERPYCEEVRMSRRRTKLGLSGLTRMEEDL